MSNPRTGRPSAQPRVRAHRGNHDPAKRAAAARLDEASPLWLVLYSLYRRQFYAVALWPLPEPVTLWARTVEDLAGQMRAMTPVVPRPRVLQDVR
ncbi:hypothetical protein Misp01_62680 [Microtetraspora sp. NBRC 13810]|uniref:hypothetical protein n=1 Tax=Microtetraspora sp. NBRC 13810 TaxID=3030990 RepID=UPI0024A324AB|nr:hypothetical protein [Microtetraspora sp. NBRC 13810]GLW11140.1 hypothetical protein Misp01_62680 [Microtetraspora sp. NBRC 13810]